MLHKYVVEKKCLAAAIIPSCSGILHSCYINCSRVLRIFCTCIMPCSIKLTSSHSWSFKLEEKKFVNHPRFEALQKIPKIPGKNSRPDGPGREEKPQVRGCRTPVQCGTGRQDNLGPGDGLGLDHGPHQTQTGSPGTFRRFWTEKEAEVPIPSPCQGEGKTWETGPPVPTYGTPTPAPPATPNHPQPARVPIPKKKRKEGAWCDI